MVLPVVANDANGAQGKIAVVGVDEKIRAVQSRLDFIGNLAPAKEGILERIDDRDEIRVVTSPHRR